MNHNDIMRVLLDNGFKAYTVGGSVRDYLLNKPSHDIDITTDAKPEDIAKLFDKTISVGAAFGTIVVVTDKGHYEVTTFRKDGSGRHPEVEFTTSVEEDSLRRDFTVNAIYRSIGGGLVDFHGGCTDLKNRLIKCVGSPDQRFSEDPLRLMRAVRLAANLKFIIDEATYKSIEKNANLITSISMERIAEELNKGLTGRDPEHFMHLMRISGLLDIVLPEVSNMTGCTQGSDHHPEGDVWTHTMLMLKPNDDLLMAWASLLHDVGKPITKDGFKFHGHAKTSLPRDILTRLKFSNAFIDTVCYLVEHHMDHMVVAQMKVSTFRKFIARPTHTMEMELHLRDVKASNGDMTEYHYIEKRKITLPPELPAPIVTGKVLIEMGHKPGVEFKAMLNRLYNLQLEGYTREQLIKEIS